MNRKLIVMLLVIVVIAAGALFLRGKRPVLDTQQVAAKLVTEPLPFEDPSSPMWDRTTEHPAALLQQNLTEPKLLDPGPAQVKVRALHNGDWVVFRLEWADATQDLIPRSGHSSDAAAIQFPLAPNQDVPNEAMGERGKAVRIWYWKALWQDDAARASAGSGDRIASLYPNAKTDHYPYEAAKDPAVQAEMAKRYAPAHAAGNPNFVRNTDSPVQVLMAEGFGTTAAAAGQTARGRGQWSGEKWVTTIARPLHGGAELGDLVVAQRTAVAFAIWDGNTAQTGSRKMRSVWIPFVLEEK